MRTLAFDGRTGAAGDMLLGALLAAGADRAVLAPVETALDVEYRVETVTRNGISATSVDVIMADDDASHDNGHGVDEGPACGDDEHDDPHEHGHDHEHVADNDDDHDLGHDHDHTHAEGHGPHRTYAECVEIVEGMDLPQDVEADATAIVRILGEAEASVHGTDLAETTFHEVGADDAIADIVGAALLIDDLSPDRVVTTPVRAGGGEVSMAHGRYPVPTPAVTYIAERADWTLRGGPVDEELLTPTGAAILAHFADGVETFPDLAVDGSGYGAGHRTFPERPNVLRAVVGEASGGLTREDIRVLETNVDDVSPEVLGSLQERLSDAGARDVTVVPTTMKKSRPGHLVKVVVKPEDAETVARRLAEETGTLGVRETGATHRWVADREFVTTTLLVDDERHAVTVKIGRDADGTAFDVSAEHDDALAVARETGLPVREVARRAETAARDGGALDDHLYHIVEADRWAALEGEYRPASLERDDTDDAAGGFVHLSPADRLVGVAQSNHLDADDPRVLVVDPDAVEAEIRYEEMPSGAFPHLFGPLPTGAVVDVLPFPRDDGRYRLPDALRD